RDELAPVHGEIDVLENRRRALGERDAVRRGQNMALLQDAGLAAARQLGQRPAISTVARVTEKPIAWARAAMAVAMPASSSSAADWQPVQIRNWPTWRSLGSAQPT